jgi:hypothetical protein
MKTNCNNQERTESKKLLPLDLIIVWMKKNYTACSKLEEGKKHTKGIMNIWFKFELRYNTLFICSSTVTIKYTSPLSATYLK